jgi:hypothetical protein
LSKLLRVVDAWEYLNTKAFGGELAKPTIVVWEDLYLTSKKTRHKLHGAYDEKKAKIWLSHDDPQKLETLYHEMVHQFMFEVLGEEKFDSHGEVFKSVYNKGLERLAV